jgi:hypothetical protein
VKVEYVCHACLLVDTGDVRIATDPWYESPAYSGQWHVFPKPVNTRGVETADVILYSHGHEDHLHEPTMRVLNKNAKVFYPYNWYGGVTAFLQSTGFADVTEAVSYRTYRLTPKTSVTYIANNMDSMMIVESDGEVLLDVNDALHAYPKRVIELFVDAIKKRWPRIDVLFCGFGGASYFPNMLHAPGKDDVEIAGAREQLFVHNFCKIAAALNPKVAVPFAADFVLLDPKQRWINATRWLRSDIPPYFQRFFTGSGANAEIHAMYPGDVLEGTRLHELSPLRARMATSEGAAELLQEQYGAEMTAREHRPPIAEESAQALVGEIAANVRARAAMFDQTTLASVIFCVRVTDVERDPCYNVDLRGGSFNVWRARDPSPASLMLLETRSEILRYSFAGEWGGDAITIGYGCDITLFDEATARRRLDTVCVRLLTRHPRATRHWLKEPLRMARYMVTNPATRAWALKAVLNPRNEYSKRKAFNEIGGTQWLTRSKCDVCRICDLPLLDETTAARL